MSDWKGAGPEAESVGKTLQIADHDVLEAFARRCIAHGVRLAGDLTQPRLACEDDFDRLANAIERDEVEV
jgi:hypothetical protein